MKPRCVIVASALLLGASLVTLHARAEQEQVQENELAPKRALFAFDAALRLSIEAPSAALYCYGPSCAPRPFASISFIKSLGGVPAAVAEYMCAGSKLGAKTTYRFGLVAAVGGPAFGLRVRW